MEIRRAGEALLRSHSGILPFLAPALTRKPLRHTPASLTRTSRQAPTLPQWRCLSTSVSRQQADDSKASSSSADKGPASKSSLTDFLDSSLDFTKGSPGTNSQGTTRYKSPTAQAENRPQPSTSVGNSFDDLLAGFTRSSGTPSQLTASQRTGRIQVGDMLDPLKNTAPITKLPLPEPLPVRLGPSLGRSVTVNNDKGVDVGRAFRTLDIACARNKVRADFNRQRFHERPGLKRKRLKSERWRKKFKEGFRGMVKMVTDMRKKGW